MRLRIDALVSDILRGVLGGRRKRSRRAAHFLTGGLARGMTRGVLSNPGTMLGIAGVAWGILETLQNQHSTAPGFGGGLAGAPPSSTPSSTLPSPMPPASGSRQPPPIPGAAPLAPAGDERVRLVRLAVSAASADGAMNEKERAALVQQVTAAGAAELLERELANPRPLPEVIAGVSDQADRATLYVLAYTILRADEQISGAERIYLAQLANLLGLDPPLVQTLEKNTGERIDALDDQGQLDG